MFQFGSGIIMATPFAVATSPFSGANPTPIQFGTLQDGSFDISGTVKELYGRNSFPDDIARAQCKITGKAKAARIYAKQFNDLFFGSFGVLATGSVIAISDELRTNVASSCTAINGATGVEDLGVRYVSSGLSLVRVASAPATGQYSVVATTGVYTFNAADATTQVLISYTYTASAVGSSVTISNMPMGQMPKFVMNLANTNSAGVSLKFKLWACVCNKITMNMKNEDYTIPEFDFTAFADASNRVLTMDFGE